MTLRSIRRCLLKHDLEGLIRLGAPRDEYNNEAKLIWDALDPDMKAPALVELIRDVFHKQFDGLSIYDYSALMALATDILEG